MNSILERFKELCQTDSDGCWRWLGGMSLGYGYTRLLGREKQQAHRVSYALFNGTIQKGFHVHHKCEHPYCVNPAHLEALAPIDHQKATPKNKRYRTHCPQGHPLEEGNLVKRRLEKYGHRICRRCEVDRTLRYHARLKATNPDKFWASAKKRTAKYLAKKKAAKLAHRELV